MKFIFLCCVAACLFPIDLAGACEQVESETGATGFFVNGKELTSADINELQSKYGIKIMDATLSDEQIVTFKTIYGVEVDSKRFWYDAVSGAWGYIGLPTAGRIQPNLPFDATLPADASGGSTSVSVNGRMLHTAEINYLRELYGSVNPGRYWLLPDGTYGLEGGGPTGRLPQSASGRNGVTGTSSFGTAIGDGDFVGYIPPRAWGDSSTPTVTCAPDGGCIF